MSIIGVIDGLKSYEGKWVKIKGMPSTYLILHVPNSFWDGLAQVSFVSANGLKLTGLTTDMIACVVPDNYEDIVAKVDNILGKEGLV